MSSPSQSFYGSQISATEIPSKSPETWLQRMDPRLRDTLEAFLKYGTVFLIFRLCSFYLMDKSSSDTTFVDKQTAKLVGFIMFGFAIYFMLVHPYIHPQFAHPIIQNVYDDTLMFGTVIIVTHLAESYMSGDKMFDMDWMRNAAYILLAFAAYRVFVNPFIPFEKMSPAVSPLVSDWAQFGTFMIAFRLLSGKSFDQNYLLAILFVLLGFTGYRLITNKLIPLSH